MNTHQISGKNREKIGRKYDKHNANQKSNY